MDAKFREQVITSLTKLDSGQQSVLEHLLRLNGRTAKNEEAIEQMKIAEAKRSEHERSSLVWSNLQMSVFGGCLVVLFKWVFEFFTA